MLRVPMGFLVPLNKDLAVDASAPKVPVLESITSLGRCDLAVDDKRVSRKQVRLRASPTGDGSVELVVEGQNPVVVVSERRGERRKLCCGEMGLVGDGDVVELIPGSHFFKYVRNVTELEKGAGCLGKGKRMCEDEREAEKRNRQVAEDEVFARYLQDKEGYGSPVAGQSQSHTVPSSQNNSEPIRHFNFSKDESSLVFRLMRVQGLPAWANTHSVSIGDVIQGNVQVAILSNYMVDVDWLLSACPSLRKIPHVLVIHGESGATVDHLKKSKPANWILHKPPLPISYGTHHSKAMLLVYPKGVRVIVHSANLIHVDWNNKSQGLWMQDFPWKGEGCPSRCPFENDLLDYLSILKWPEFNVSLPSIGNVSINSSFFKKFDYRSAAVRLIASVPGYHTGANLKRWGHMKLRTILEECVFDKEFCKSPLVYQFSSLGSLDEKWLSELALSMSSGFMEEKVPLGLGKPLIIWPTVEDVRCSLEGYAAGNAIPSPQKNVEKEFLKKYWARWKASHTGRSRAMPHIKTYTRYNGQKLARAMPHIKTYTRYNGQKLAWFLLTSANLSKAAWGSLQKNNSQVMIRSYELGVLFLSSAIHNHGSGFSCTEHGDHAQVGSDLSTNELGRNIKLTTLFVQRSETSNSSSEIISLPVPYELPPQPYSAEDVPWSWDKRFTKKDVYCQVWPRQVQLYMDQK